MNEKFKIVGLVQLEDEVLEISGIVKLAKLGLHIQGLNKDGKHTVRDWYGNIIYPNKEV